jgi:hypothetical protein
MAKGSGTDPTLGTTTSVGRYFGLVSTIPSVVLAGWVYVLLAAGSWTGKPSPETLWKNNPVDEPGYLVAAVALAVALAVIGHPVQFVIVQLLEGYWGTSGVARRLHDRLVLKQLSRLARAHDLKVQRNTITVRLPDVDDASEYVDAETVRLRPDVAAMAVSRQALQDAADAIESRYPTDAIFTMPTRLGNVLRRHELIAGAAVGLPVLDWATHIGMVAAPEHGAYVNDQRTQLDLAVRTSAMAAVAAVFTFVLLWDEGTSVLLTLIPYLVAWVSYRGAVASAESYGLALRAWVDLNRFRLYEALGLPPVRNAAEEREQNKRLDDLRLGIDEFDMRLTPPARPVR